MISRAGKSFLFGAPIGMLGGLIGLGGAEFRLPVLKSIFNMRAKSAVTMNLLISYITVISAFITRISISSIGVLGDILPILLALMFFSMMGAYIGSTYLHKTSEVLLEKVITLLLTAIGLLLLCESFFPFDDSYFSFGLGTNLLMSGILGSLIGIISSLLGVAGGELIIPTLILVFGVEIKLAGTASLLISIATISVGILRYLKQGYYADKVEIKAIAISMSIGSMIGAVIGGAMIGLISSEVLKFVLGLILIIAAVRMSSYGKK